MSFGMHGEVFEPKSTGTPFQNIDIRKVAMWMFLMSEMMVFTSLFSTYMRYRLGIPNCKTVFHSRVVEDGRDLLRARRPSDSIELVPHRTRGDKHVRAHHLLFTIVQALRYAKKKDIDEDVRRRKVTRYPGPPGSLQYSSSL